jgi:hypothetical protein
MIARVTAAAVGLLALLACGACSDTGTATSGHPANPAPTTASPTPLPSLSFPRVAEGCEPDDGWSTERQSDWARVHVKPSTGDFVVTLVETTYQMQQFGYNRPLCTAFPIQVEYWKVTFTDVPDAPGTTVDRYSFTLASVARTQLVVDGRKEQTVRPPAGFETGPCVGLLEAVYAGGPLQEAELPDRITNQTSLVSGDVRFRSDRIANQNYLKPDAPKGC